MPLRPPPHKTESCRQTAGGLPLTPGAGRGVHVGREECKAGCRNGASHAARAVLCCAVSCHAQAIGVTNVSRAFWRADVTKEPLQRVYAITFPDKAQLKEYQRREFSRSPAAPAASRPHSRLYCRTLKQRCQASCSLTPGPAPCCLGTV